MKPAERINEIQEYYFSRKLKEVAKLNAEGQDIISLAIGSPDMPPSEQTVNKLCEVAHDPNAHGYQPTAGLPELRQAMAAFYKRTYGVDVDWKTELQPIIGSKEGIMYVTLAFCNPGDEVLIPDPGYPTYTAINKIFGTKIRYYDLKEDNGWQPDFETLEKMDLSRVKRYVDQLPQYADGRKRADGDFREARRLRQTARHRGGKRQSLLADSQRASYEHSASAGSEGSLHRVQLDVEEPQYARMASGDDD